MIKYNQEKGFGFIKDEMKAVVFFTLHKFKLKMNFWIILLIIITLTG